MECSWETWYEPGARGMPNGANLCRVIRRVRSPRDEIWQREQRILRSHGERHAAYQRAARGCHLHFAAGCAGGQRLRSDQIWATT